MSSASELLHEITNATAWVTFNRPEQRNALTFAMYEGLAEICANAPTDGSVKAIVIRGAAPVTGPSRRGPT
jgi:enoyl-CoA hydratase/carnithine racemase